MANLLNLPKEKIAYHPMVAIDLIDEITMMGITLFTRENDVTALFIDKWGDQYVSNAMDLWAYARDVYKTNKAHSLEKNELVFVLCYDYAAGGHINEKGDSLPFYKWIFKQIKVADKSKK